MKLTIFVRFILQELMEKENRRARKARARKAKAESRLQAKVARSTSSGADDNPTGSNAVNDPRGSASGSSTLGRRMLEAVPGLSRRGTRRARVEEGEEVELGELRRRRIERERQGASEGADANLPLPATTSQAGSPNPQQPSTPPVPGSGMSTTSSPTSTSSSPTAPPPPSNLSTLVGYPYALSVYILSRLARAHDEATKARVGRLRQNGPGEEERRGWGLGEFGVEEVRGGEERLRDAQREVREGRLLSAEDREEARESEWVDEEVIRPAGGRATRRKRSLGEGRSKEGKKQKGVGESGWSWWGPLRMCNHTPLFSFVFWC